MTAVKPTILLIHGGWHVPQSYSKLTTALEAAGYEVHIPRLPSVNESRPPNADLAKDTALVRSSVESLIDAGRNVLVLMHSYGGQVGTNAVHGLGLESRTEKGLPGGVSNLVYMCAFALPEAFDFADDDSCVHRDPKMLLIGPHNDEAETDAYISSHVRWNGKSMYQEVTHCAWREIPVTYIYTTQDMTVPLAYQKSMVETMRGQGREVHTVELATGHCPNLTMTNEVVDVVNRVVAGRAI